MIVVRIFDYYLIFAQNVKEKKVRSQTVSFSPRGIISHLIVQYEAAASCRLFKLSIKTGNKGGN